MIGSRLFEKPGTAHPMTKVSSENDLILDNPAVRISNIASQ
jgi:hypothetical protein